ncbi:MAG: Gfo/Idh/MocA family oxidoreductase [Chloroflexi bacterium]|nr:Gfo/Idh/MocA family oxidoreductase [Chloroflexota bacterium]OJV86845.1 MAG: dehydrogenase [Chloroflexi bacterium 54-19]
MDKIRWGILSTGGIAKVVTEAIQFLDDAEVVAVGSRTAEAAEEFGARFNIPHRHASYEALANDPDVDAIYIATPHNLHKENALLSLAGGKAVLLEKPFTVNAREAAEVIDFAREKNLFVMEAMWSRFIPLMGKLREMLAAGVIGDIRMFHADCSIRIPYNPKSRMFDLDLAGGALLDSGIYPFSMASMVMGKPESVVSQAFIGESGADEQAAAVLKYSEGRLSILSTAIRTAGPQEMLIRGTEGYIRIAGWQRATKLTITRPGQPDEVVEMGYEGNGKNYQVAEVMRCMRAGLIESPVMPLSETLDIMSTLDAVRAPWGLKYPGE